MKRKIFVFLIFVNLIFLSCSSLQTDIYVEHADFSESIMRFENRFIALDGSEKKSNTDITSLIADIEVALVDNSLKSADRARLLAMQGSLYLFLSNDKKALELYNSSVSAYKGDVRSLILASRLGLDKKLEKKLSETNEPNIIKIELALNAFEKSNYVQAVSLFDEAFLALDAIYRDSYESKRNAAWNMQKLSGANVSSLLKNEKLTVSQMLALVNDSSDLLYNYVGGKKISNAELYKKINSQGLLTSVTPTKDSKKILAEKEIVTKYAAARFFWNLWNARKNTMASAAKYSTRFLKAHIDSPIADVELENPDFDAVVGCVENEIINLEDGKNFNGTKIMSGSELYNSTLKINNY